MDLTPKQKSDLIKFIDLLNNYKGLNKMDLTPKQISDLIMLIDLLKKYEKFFINGLCGFISELFERKIITKEKRLDLVYLLESIKPKMDYYHAYGSYWFAPGYLDIRKQYLQSILDFALLKESENNATK